MTAAGVRQSKPEAFKPHALKVAERARAMCGAPREPCDPEAAAEAAAALRLAEIHQWKHHVVDLHRVLSVAQGMFLLLEHHNEALLRVAIEIVCCDISSKILWWTEEWYSDDERRQYFREMVNGMLLKCLAYMNVEPPDDVGRDRAADEEELRKALERASMAEASRNALEHSKQMIEMQVRELEASLAEAQAREKEMQKANERMQAELRSAAKEPTEVGPDPALVDKLAQLEAKLKMSEQEKAMMAEKLAAAEQKAQQRKPDPDLDAANARIKELEGMVRKEQDRAAAAEKKAADAVAEVAKLKRAPPKPGKPAEPAPVVEKVVGIDRSAVDEEIQGLQSALDQQKNLADKLTDEVERLKRECERLKIQAETPKIIEKEVIVERAVEVVVEKVKEVESPKQEKQAPPPVAPPPKREPKPQQEEEPSSRSPRQPRGVSQEEYDAKCRELEKAMAKIASQRSKLKELSGEKEELEARNDKMLKMLHQLKEQLKRITEIANQKGCGDLVNSILDEAGVIATLESAEFTCYDRLYEDAKRRMEKHRQWELEKMGLRPRSPLEGRRGRAAFNSQTWAPGPGSGQNWALSGQPSAPPDSGDQTPFRGEGANAASTGAWAANSAGAWAANSAGSPFSHGFPPAATWPRAGAEPASHPARNGGSPNAPLQRAWGNGDAGDWQSDSADFDAYAGMRVVGYGHRPFSGAGSRPGSSWALDANARATTPTGVRTSPAPATDAATQRAHQLAMRPSHSLSALSLDMQGAPHLSSSTPARRKLGDSRSAGRLDADGMIPFYVPSAEDGSPTLSGNVWAGFSSGVHADRTGPGKMRGFKLVGQRGRPHDGSIPR